MNFFKDFLLEKLLSTRLYLMKQQTEPTDFIGKIKNVRKILVIVPRNRALEVLTRKYVARLKEAFPGSRLASLDTLSLKKTDVNWMGVPNEQFIDRFRKEKYDLLIDLNTYHDTLCSYLCSMAEADIRLHICEGRYDKIYNLHIRTDSNTSLERRYTELLDKLTKLSEMIRQAPAA